MNLHFSKKIEKFYKKNSSKINFDEFLELPDIVENICIPKNRPDDLIDLGFAMANNCQSNDVQVFYIDDELVIYVIGSEEDVLNKINKLIN